jgi:hypothetical protein
MCSAHQISAPYFQVCSAHQMSEPYFEVCSAHQISAPHFQVCSVHQPSVAIVTVSTLSRLYFTSFSFSLPQPAGLPFPLLWYWNPFQNPRRGRRITANRTGWDIKHVFLLDRRHAQSREYKDTTPLGHVLTIWRCMFITAKSMN